MTAWDDVDDAMTDMTVTDLTPHAYTDRIRAAIAAARAHDVAHHAALHDIVVNALQTVIDDVIHFAEKHGCPDIGPSLHNELDAFRALSGASGDCGNTIYAALLKADTDLAAVQLAGRALVTKLDAVHMAIFDVIYFAETHGYPYAGPSLKDELDAFRALLHTREVC